MVYVLLFLGYKTIKYVISDHENNLPLIVYPVVLGHTIFYRFFYDDIIFIIIFGSFHFTSHFYFRIISFPSYSKVVSYQIWYTVHCTQWSGWLHCWNIISYQHDQKLTMPLFIGVRLYSYIASLVSVATWIKVKKFAYSFCQKSYRSYINILWKQVTYCSLTPPTTLGYWYWLDY